MFGFRKKPSQKRNIFRPILEPLETRLVPTMLVWYPSNNPDVGHDNAWGTAHNWRMGSSGGPESPSAPGNSDTAVLSGAVDNTSCTSATGSPGAINIQDSYSGTLSLGGNLAAGNSEMSSILAAGTIDVGSNKLTLKGTHDEWDACDMIGSGTVEIASGDAVARNSGVNSLEYDKLVVDSGGSLTFNSTGAFDFGTSGTMTIAGTVTIQPSPQGTVDFQGSINSTPWNIQGGTLDCRNTGNWVIVPVGITSSGGANIIVEACTTLKVYGDVILGSSGGADTVKLNLWAGANGAGSSSKTLLSATGTLKAYGDSRVQQTHNNPGDNPLWVYSTIDCAVEMHDYSVIEADGDQSGNMTTSRGLAPTMSLTGSLAFWNDAIVDITSYTNGNTYLGCSYIMCATLTFNYVGHTPRYVFDGSTVPNEKMKFLYVGAGTWSGTPWAAPVGWNTTYTQYSGGGMDFFCQNY